MGAPKANRNAAKPDAEKCSERIVMHVTPTQKATLERKARRKGMSVKTYLLEGK